MQRRVFLTVLIATAFAIGGTAQLAHARGGKTKQQSGTFTGVVAQVSGKIVLVDIGTDKKNLQPYTIGPNTTISGGATGTVKDLARGETVSVVVKNGTVESISITDGAPAPKQG